MQKERKQYVDWVGALMILYMVYGHIAQRYGFYDNNPISKSLLYVFGCFMPWFFYKGGMFFKEQSLKITLISSLRRLIYPYIAWSVIGTIVLVLCNYVKTGDIDLLKVFADFFYSIFYNGSVEGNLPLWFLLSLFCVRFMHQFYVKIKYNNLILFIILFLISYMLYLNGINKPRYLGNICLGWLFFGLGNELKNIQFDRKLFAISVILFFTIEIFYFSNVGFRSNTLICGNYILWFVESLCGIIIFNNVFSLIENRTDFSNTLTARILSYIGKNTMVIYISHWPILFIVDIIIYSLYKVI